MRCSCKICGTYMVQRERGVESGCVCPQCFNVCTACISPAGGRPLSPEALKEVYFFGRFEGDDAPIGAQAEADGADTTMDKSPMRPEEYID